MNKSDNLTGLTSVSYDAQITSTIPYYDCFHKETINLVQTIIRSPRLWLDTGCGTGNLVMKALGKFPKTTFLLADPSKEMLALARKKFENIDRVVFSTPVFTQELCSVMHEKADIITAILSHHYFSLEKRKNATQTCYELLNNGGVYVTFEIVRPFSRKGIEIGKARWAEYQVACGKSREAASNNIDRFGKENFPITIEDHLKLYRDCGFEVVELFWYSQMQAGFYCLKSS